VYHILKLVTELYEPRRFKPN